jgi:prepilin-type N-terminal cleavage/methylation domain-containing protein
MRKIRLSSQVRKAFQGSSRGFTFIEVLLAIALVGVISVAFMSALSTATNVLITADERTTTESLARRQMEYVKNQGYNPASVLNNYNPTYQKISDIPEGYYIWSLNSTGELVEDIVGIPWDSSEENKPIDTDKGLQKIALVIKHKDKENQIKVIYTFINDNLYWANGAQITLECYKVDR